MLILSGCRLACDAAAMSAAHPAAISARVKEARTNRLIRPGWDRTLPRTLVRRSRTASFPAAKHAEVQILVHAVHIPETRFFHPPDLVCQLGVKIHVPALDRRVDLLRCQPAGADGCQPAAPEIPVHFGCRAFHQVGVDE